MSLWRRAYDAVPQPLQGLAVGMVGRWNHPRRFGPVFRKDMDRLQQNETRSVKEMERIAARELNRLLRYAAEEIPYYRSLAAAPENLSAWPILEKSRVQEQPLQFLPGGRADSRFLRLQSSGTTGAPLTVYCSAEAYQTEMAFRWRHKAWAGLSLGARGAYVAGHAVVSPGRRKPPFWAHDPAENRLLLSSYHISDETAPSYLRALEKFAPEFLHGYPSSLHLLALAALRHGSAFRPRAVFTASETLLAAQRDTIRRAFGARVFNWYGQTELTCNIVECERGRLHARTDYGFLEVLEDGSMVCTGLNNLAMPLIRYRTGDQVRLREGACDCGRPFPLVEEIEGRVEDYVVTPEGYLIGRLDHLFKGVLGVREAQVVQRERSALILRVVREGAYSERSEGHIREEARKRVGSLMRVVFEYPERIERGAGGKFRFVVSECSTQRDADAGGLLASAVHATSRATTEVP